MHCASVLYIYNSYCQTP